MPEINLSKLLRRINKRYRDMNKPFLHASGIFALDELCILQRYYRDDIMLQFILNFVKNSYLPMGEWKS